MEAAAVDPIEVLSGFELHDLVYWILSFLNLPVGAPEIDNSAIDVLMTRAEGWTAGITVAQLDLPRMG